MKSKIYEFPQGEARSVFKKRSVKSRPQKFASALRVGAGRGINLMRYMLAGALEVGCAVLLAVLYLTRNFIGAFWFFTCIWLYFWGGGLWKDNGYVFIAGFMFSVLAHVADDISRYLVKKHVFFRLLGIRNPPKSAANPSE